MLVMLYLVRQAHGNEGVGLVAGLGAQLVDGALGEQGAVSESTPPLMPSTKVLSRALARQSLMNATRRATSASSAAASANGGCTFSAWAISC